MLSALLLSRMVLTVNADEQHDLRKLLELLERIQPWEKWTGEPSNVWDVQAGSPLAGDNAKTAPYHLSHAARNALMVAVDHLACLRHSLVEELKEDHFSVRIHTHAQSSLVRGAIENGGRAAWMLGPRTRLTRVTRRLSLEAMELPHSYRLRELVKATPKHTKVEREKQLQSLAIAAGVPGPEVNKALRSPKYKDIVREAGTLTDLGSDQAEFLWTGCSSLAHGDFRGTVDILEKEIISWDQDIALARVTHPIGFLYFGVLGAVGMIDHGFKLYRKRAVHHHSI